MISHANSIHLSITVKSLVTINWSQSWPNQMNVSEEIFFRLLLFAICCCFCMRALSRPWKCKWICVFFFGAENWIEAPVVCRYFLNGNCRYGDYCRNSHVMRPDAVVPITTAPITTVPTTMMVTAPIQPIVGNTESNDPNNNNCSRPSEAMRNWIDAPEFVPTRQKNILTQNTSCDRNLASSNDVQGASRLVTLGSTHSKSYTLYWICVIDTSNAFR